MGRIFNFLYSIRKPGAKLVKLRSKPCEFFTAVVVKVNFTASVPTYPARSTPERIVFLVYCLLLLLSIKPIRLKLK